ncbi:MAG: glycosyltransferase [Candidatus Kapaibacteriota bacterium]
MSYSVLHIAPENFAGVPHDFKRMHERFGNHSRLITLHRNPLGFEEDICCDFAIPRSRAAKSYRIHHSLAKQGRKNEEYFWEPHSFLEQLYFFLQTKMRVSTIESMIHTLNLDAFDIIQYDGGLDFTRDSRFAKRWKSMKKPIVNCYYGSDLRARGIIKEMDDFADLNITSEFDHLALKSNLEYVFYPYDSSELPNIPTEKDYSRIRIVHSPTNRLYKGTEVILSVIEKLQKSYAFEFLLLENMSRADVLSIKSECTISIDQVGGIHGATGYGKAGIESLAMGIPTITNMTSEYASWLPENPFLIANDAKSLEDQLIHLIESPEQCKAIGEQGRDWVQRYHSYEQVNQHLESLYHKYGIL